MRSYVIPITVCSPNVLPRDAKRYPARSSEILSLGFQLSGKLASSRLAGVNDARERVLKLLWIGRGSGRG